MEARQRDRGGPLDLVAASDTFKEPLALDDDHYTFHGLEVDKTRKLQSLLHSAERGCSSAYRFPSCGVAVYHAQLRSLSQGRDVLTFDYHRNDFQRKKLTESTHPSPVPILIPFLLFYYCAASVSACSVYSTSDVLPASFEFITPPPPATMSTRAPPLRAEERPPAYRMVTRVYNNSLRPFVIVIGSVVAIWSLVWAIPSFQDINEDKSNGQPKFAVFDIVLGTIYATACAIEVFGVIAAATQRLFMVRIYAVLSLVGSLAVVAAGFMRVVLHFVFKVRVLAASPRARMADLRVTSAQNGLIDECKQIAQGQGIEIRFGIWFHHFKEKLTADEADSFCKSAWNRDSLNEILFLIFEIGQSPRVRPCARPQH
ncbi:hypothetical protein NUW54_g3528 [Trametes sanguinea]|uniref:Uncharacterized protein n=1 Tax=Trametes sanguinea TaxID=158606 RepID=A0ACC1Q261_9APHY|nr:hypothetical protein NUW54_g3528 [Trametes sanguinea]